MIAQDSRFGDLSEADRNTIPEAIRATDRRTLSYLWVLGAYEVVRTMHERAVAANDAMAGKIGNVKHRFERVRIPLAKMEPARRHKDTDSPIAYPAIHRDLGIAWQLTADEFVTRRELSDAMLELLTELRRVDPLLP